MSDKQNDEESTPLLLFLEAPEDVLELLCVDHFCAAALLRWLPELSRLIVMRLALLGERGIDSEKAVLWCHDSKESREQWNAAWNQLHTLRLVDTTDDSMWRLRPSFCEAILQLISQDSKDVAVSSLSESERETLAAAQERWLAQNSFFNVEEQQEERHTAHSSASTAKRRKVDRDEGPIEDVEAYFESVVHQFCCDAVKQSDQPLPCRPPDAVLHKFAKRRFAAVHRILAGITEDEDGKAAPPSTAVLEAMIDSGLLDLSEDDVFRITAKGFVFLLQSFTHQAWSILMKGLPLAQSVYGDEEELDSDNFKPISEIISFLFRLSFMESGEEIPLTSLSAAQRTMLPLVCGLGLVFGSSEDVERISKSTSRRDSTVSKLYATVLARGLSPGFGARSSELTAEQEGFVLLETNYRIYAYTRSTLQISLLSMFVTMVMRLENMCVGLITRESIRNALKNGISAVDIVKFLQLHSHPAMSEQESSGGGVITATDETASALRNPWFPLPLNLVEQIFLWEKERERVTYTAAVLIDRFTSDEDFEEMCDAAKQRGIYLWAGSDKRGRPRLVIEAGEGNLAFLKSVAGNL